MSRYEAGVRLAEPSTNVFRGRATRFGACHAGSAGAVGRRPRRRPDPFRSPRVQPLRLPDEVQAEREHEEAIRRCSGGGGAAAGMLGPSRLGPGPAIYDGGSCFGDQVVSTMQSAGFVGEWRQSPRGAAQRRSNRRGRCRRCRPHGATRPRPGFGTDQRGKDTATNTKDGPGPAGYNLPTLLGQLPDSTKRSAPSYTQAGRELFGSTMNPKQAAKEPGCGPRAATAIAAHLTRPGHLSHATSPRPRPPPPGLATTTRPRETRGTAARPRTASVGATWTPPSASASRGPVPTAPPTAWGSSRCPRALPRRARALATRCGPPYTRADATTRTAPVRRRHARMRARLWLRRLPDPAYPLPPLPFLLPLRTGAYPVPSTVGSQVLSSHPTSPNFSFGSSTRPAPHGKVGHAPGPGRYKAAASMGPQPMSTKPTNNAARIKGRVAFGSPYGV